MFSRYEHIYGNACRTNLGITCIVSYPDGLDIGSLTSSKCSNGFYPILGVIEIICFIFLLQGSSFVMFVAIDS
jgi:hypothetical protein